ncbi:Gfo/Idh/MocA family protein [Propionivibrio sp.]|uniref:Gfo/Idh/MocA family protein n=1 Tax=Propionivibrio sp. TaxID=2212460 RepID=UPI0039E41966
MPKKISVAIVGSGVMGGIHGKIAQQSGAASVNYVVDADLAKAQKCADLHRATALRSIGELAGKNVNLAFVCVPNNHHARVAIELLNLKLDVFCEKPLATSAADARLMIEAAQVNDRRLFVGHNRRFAPVYLAAKEAVRGKYFSPQSINMIQNDGDMGGEGSLWAANFAQLGGFLYDTTIHFLDMAEFLLGPIASISALSRSCCYPVNDNFTIHMQFRDSGSGVISSCGHASWIFPFERVQVVGDHQAVITEELDEYRHCPGLSRAIDGKTYAKLAFEEKWGYVAMHTHMYDALASGGKAIHDARIGLRAVELVEACQKSATSQGAFIDVAPA